MFDYTPPVGGVDVATPHSDGRWISERVSRIVEAINDYDPSIDVQWVPPDQRELGDPTFRLMETRPNGQRFIMFYVQDENAFDESVLARIFQSDATKNKLTLSSIDANNDAIRAVKLKKQMEELEEAGDFLATALKSPLHTFRHEGKRYGS